MDGSTRSPYEILGVASTADLAEVRSAYRKQIALYHPDKVVALGPDLRALAEARAKEINAVYALLCDAAQRAAYDLQIRQEVAPPAPANPSPFQQPPASSAPERKNVRPGFHVVQHVDPRGDIREGFRTGILGLLGLGAFFGLEWATVSIGTDPSVIPGVIGVVSSAISILLVLLVYRAVFFAVVAVLLALERWSHGGRIRAAPWALLRWTIPAATVIVTAYGCILLLGYQADMVSAVRQRHPLMSFVLMTAGALLPVVSLGLTMTCLWPQRFRWQFTVTWYSLR